MIGYIYIDKKLDLLNQKWKKNKKKATLHRTISNIKNKIYLQYKLTNALHITPNKNLSVNSLPDSAT